MARVIGLPTPPRQLYRLFIWKKYCNHDVGIYPKVQKMVNHVLKSVTMLLSIFLNFMVVISTMTKKIEVITTQTLVRQDFLAGQAAIKQNPFAKLN